MKHLFERLKYLVDECAEGSARAMAREVGPSEATFGSYLRRENESRVKYGTLLAIVQRYGVDPAWLLTGQGEPWPGGKPATHIASASLRDMSVTQMELAVARALSEEVRTRMSARVLSQRWLSSTSLALEMTLDLARNLEQPGPGHVEEPRAASRVHDPPGDLEAGDESPPDAAVGSK